MFRDEINIKFKSGRGGDGHVSFGRDLKPNGGEGGDGGNVYLEGAMNEYDFSYLKAFQLFEAGVGEKGGKNRLSGANGRDVILKVPLTTKLYDLEGNILLTIDTIGERKMLLKGGRGGLGNFFYKKAHGVDLYRFSYGKDGEAIECKLKLELFSDIIFIGLPNAGKSSILNQLTNAEAKIGAYAFTTVIPQQGRMDGITLMDLPGLIEGTHAGKGLGNKFLKHTKTAKVLAHFISAESEDIKDDYETIRKEVENLGEELALKKEVIVLTKTDAVSPEKLKEQLKALKAIKSKHYATKDIIAVSVFDDKSLQEAKTFFSSSL